MVQARLNGLLPPDFNPDDMPLIDLANPRSQASLDYGLIEISDARNASDDRSEAERLAEDGFVLLPHATQVRDWDADVASVYLPEIQAVVRERLFPGRKVEIQQFASIVRRGRGTDNPYAGGVHSDGPLTAEKYALNVGAFASAEAEQWWRARYERHDVRGFVNVDFWRTTNMTEPLQHMPLALCRPTSLERADIVQAQMIGIARERNVSNHLMLRFNPAQSWAYYSGMRSDELLAFKLCEFWKDDADAAPQNVFHTAFEQPGTPPDAEHRQSCEHRVGVLILDD
jgi:hypothetical protein